ncbi:hypothetical protein IFM89_020747 [Coptis chinensis]|uniref:Rx N-terminal domain-containing protein n=1 Tax=Coptis chinensis TaxID=261450 RepID=A0A835IDD2_9MAGN|nr:hypothetical protein IFM89_020747 [Coptis chinensis]
MADAVISVVLEQLRSILQTEVNLLAGVRKESEQLEDTLTHIRGVLEDAEEKQVKNEAVKVWLKQLTRISYDADDVLDEWKTRNLSSQIQQLDAPVSEKDRDELVKLWMAQGFLGYDSSKDLEKVGTNFFNDLAMRSLFQDFKKDSEGNVIGCKMHDLVLDFAQHLAVSESAIDMKIRHLGVANDSGARPKLIIRQMTCLRVLDLSSPYFRLELPHEVDRLLHLRLLKLSYMTMEELPETVCNLFNLQTLELNECISLMKLPEGIGKLRNLRHLELKGTYRLSYFPRGLERLICLRTLSKVVLDRDGGKGCQIGELKLLDHIQGELRIEGLGQVADSKAAELKKKRSSGP